MLFVRMFDLCLFGLSVSSSSWCLGRAAVCDCGTPWTFLLPFWVEKYSDSLKTLLQQGISGPEFYGDLVYKFRKIVRKSNFRGKSENLLTVMK